MCALHASGNVFSRLGKCEVCDANFAKYTCPQCEVKTCSLPCVKIHKKELLCEGKRNKVKYVPLNKFTCMDLQNDYTLLEEAGRTIRRISENKTLHYSKRDSLREVKLRKAARVRGITLEFLPQKFSRHKENTTYLNWKTGELYWKVQWVFPEANHFTVTDQRVLDTCTLQTALAKYISAEWKDEICNEDILSLYRRAGKDGLKIIIKAEKVAGNKFYEADFENTISYNLMGKIVLEHPIFYIIHSENLKNYEIEKEVPKAVHQDKCFKLINKNNFFFPTADCND